MKSCRLTQSLYRFGIVIGVIVAADFVCGQGIPVSAEASSEPRAWQSARIGFSLANLQSSISGTIGAGQSKTVLIQICNGASTPDTFRVKGSASAGGLKVTYLSNAGVNVTAQVVAGTYSVSLNKGAKSLLKTKVNVLATATAGNCQSVKATVTPLAHLANRTTVTFRVTVGGHATYPSDMVLIPSGSFSMGNALSASGDGNLDELPVHTVNLSAFHIDQYEVTKAKWDEVRAWAVVHGYGFDYPGEGKASDHPVQMMKWYDAVKWCNARSEKEGLVPCYYTDDAQTAIYRVGSIAITSAQVKWTANGYRLPTEAEWEKAARGGLSGKRFPLGDTISHSEANYDVRTSDGTTHYYGYDVSPTFGCHPTYVAGGVPYTNPVGVFGANGYGLYDMTGNVWEWCWDHKGDYPSASQTDPRGSETGARVLRGGGWWSYAVSCRVASRGTASPSIADDEWGFRCVRK
jgi:formylglycine-generating enzyme